MHELGILNSLLTIIEQVAEENNLVKINNVTLKLGKLQQIVPEMLTCAFETITKETKAEGATLHVEYVPILMKCTGCENEFTIEDHVYICPTCSGTSLVMKEGMEVILESVEGEQA